MEGMIVTRVLLGTDVHTKLRVLVAQKNTSIQVYLSDTIGTLVKDVPLSQGVPVDTNVPSVPSGTVGTKKIKRTKRTS